MIERDDTNSGRKRIFGWLTIEEHAQAKARAAIEHKNLEDWVREAILEKLARESGKVVPIERGRRGE